MKLYLYGLIIFMVGVLIGWLNPIEGPLDRTYDEYSSKKYPSKVAPILKVKSTSQEFEETEDTDKTEDADRGGNRI